MSNVQTYDPVAGEIKKNGGSFPFFTGDEHLIGIAFTLVRFIQKDLTLQEAFECIKWDINRLEPKSTVNNLTCESKYFLMERYGDVCLSYGAETLQEVIELAKGEWSGN